MMNKSLLLLLLVVSSFSSAVAKVGKKWTLLWCENFDSFNESVWNYDLGTGENGWGNGEHQNYTKSNVKVEDGLLKITAEKEGEGKDASFTSGRINTLGKVAFKYGRLEANLSIPELGLDAGLWPAFWTIGADFPNTPWPKSGEIDVFEMGGGSAIDKGTVNREVWSAAHWWDDVPGKYSYYDGTLVLHSDINGTFHVVVMEWYPWNITTYIDGHKIWVIDIDEHSCPYCEELRWKHSIVINMAVGGAYTASGSNSSSPSGSHSSSSSPSACKGEDGVEDCVNYRPKEDITAPFPATFSVDYVKIYGNEHTEIHLPEPDPSEPEPVESGHPSVSPSAAPSSDVPSASPSVSNAPSDGKVEFPSTSPSDTIAPNLHPSISVAPSHGNDKAEPEPPRHPDCYYGGKKCGSGKKYGGDKKYGSGKKSGSGKRSGSKSKSKGGSWDASFTNLDVNSGSQRVSPSLFTALASIAISVFFVVKL